MPAAPKSPSTRRTGAPKAKGAVRAKSGCYTCRIRRKKCDEQPNDAGQCQTCVRLRLECLGFGTKRPEWLRESRNVVDLREKIKEFLAAQGMIKGHSGSGPRNAEHEPPMLRLAEDYSSSSESPPRTPTLSLSSNENHRQVHVSSVREQPWSLDSSFGHPGLHYPPQMRPDSPYGGSSHGSMHDIHPVYQQMPTIPSPSNSLVASVSPAYGSSFSPTYHMNYEDESENLVMFEPSNDGNVYYDLPRYLQTFMPPDIIDGLVAHYVENVVKIQYILADSPIRRMIFDTVASHEPSRKAVGLLASVHWNRFQKPEQAALGTSETQRSIKSLQDTLLDQTKISYSAEDAMAALHVVSSILFDGGHGCWDVWLKVACVYVDSVLHDSRFLGPEDALMNCSPKEAFVIKTAIWFDVLASVTTQEPPYFLRSIRSMFDPSRSTIMDTASLTSASDIAQYSMMSPMGCENHVVWAMAETSYLSYWKRDQINKGCLSVPDLVAKGADIEACVASRPPMHLHRDDTAYCRQLASEIFRSSTRLYLRSVVSGDFPHVAEIKESVEETIRCIEKVPIGVNMAQQSIARSVVRSTVFSIFICGSLADEPRHRKVILDQLDRETGEGVGNCSSIRLLLQKVWASRENSERRSPVEWRNVLKQWQMLLV